MMRITMRAKDGSPKNADQVALGWRTAPRSERPVLFINPRSGGGTAGRVHLAERAQERGAEVVVLGPDQLLEDGLKEAVAAGADALGMAGGDGSMATVAASAIEHDLPFICIPAGTRNHFARDLGVNWHDVQGSLGAFSDPLERRIDVAEVNGRVFLNNVSLGIYGEAVRHSEYRDAKLRTLAETVNDVLGPGGAADDLHLTDDRGREHTQPAVVLVSNNPYAFEGPLAHGGRPSLNGGVLGVVVLDARPEGPGPIHAWTASSLEVGGHGQAHAGIDGESVELAPPLVFRSRPSALRVRISSDHPGMPAPAR
jgi:diacylglycerol kinase family enzyme